MFYTGVTSKTDLNCPLLSAGEPKAIFFMMTDIEEGSKVLGAS